MPTWTALEIRFDGTLAQGGTIEGLEPHEWRKEDLRQGIYPKERPPPYVHRWPDDYKHRRAPRQAQAQTEGGWGPRPAGPAPAGTEQGSQVPEPAGPPSESQVRAAEDAQGTQFPPGRWPAQPQGAGHQPSGQPEDPN